MAVLSLLGCIAQINPVWLYGPFQAYDVSSPSQPDWYVGWLEGALRLGPSWSWHVFGRTIPPPFFVAILVPLLFFAILYAWPFIERRITKDDAPHQLLDGGTDKPWRTAIGVGALTFMTVLTLAGSDDIQATWLRVELQSIVRAYQVMIFVLPVAAAMVAFSVARELQKRREHGEDQRRIILVRTPEGGFQELPSDQEETPVPDHTGTTVASQ